MRKLISIILIVMLSGVTNILVFADKDSDDLAYINIRPKHAVALPGDDSLYYGYIYFNEKFSTDNLNYTATAEYGVSNVRIDVGIRGNCTVSGNKEYDLNVGKNIISLTVTQPSGISKVYTITITRKSNPDDDTRLSYLSIVTDINGYNMIAISPEYSPEITEYNAKVENDITKIRLRCEDGNKSSLGGEYSLKTGENKIEISATSKSGLKKVYTFNVYREKSFDNTFSNIIIEEYDTKNIKFEVENINYNPESLIYKLDVSYDAAAVNLGLTCDTASQVKGHGFYKLKVGENKINVNIIAENGDSKTYTLIINRAKPSANLDSLEINEYFCGTDQGVYSLDVNYSTSKAKISAVAEDNRSAMVTGNGEFKLKLGTNKFTVTVKSADGKVKKYPIVINRLKQSNVKTIIIWITK